MNANDLALLVRRRIESRYRRLVFAHKELARIDTLARAGAEGQGSAAAGAVVRAGTEPAAKTSPPGTFEDFVFGSIDFSVYKKIDADEFTLLFDEGLDDYADSFFVKMFAMNREETRNIIRASYIKAGPFFVCKKSSTLLLSIMRTIHTSLDFAPLIGGGEVGGSGNVRAAAAVFDGLVIRHDDGMETKLFSPKAAAASGADTVSAADAAKQPLLRGTFFPLGKACTITLIPDPAVP